jgi:hypothetical protein
MMRGPQYFSTPNGPMPYPPQVYGGGFNMEEDPMNYGGRGGRGGRGRTMGGRGARGQGRSGMGGRTGTGRGRFNHQHSSVSNSSHGDSGRNTPSDPTQPMDAPVAAPPPSTQTPAPLPPSAEASSSIEAEIPLKPAADVPPSDSTTSK